MGICESVHHGKSLAIENQKRNIRIKEKTFDKENEKKDETLFPPNNFSQTKEINYTEEEIKNNDEKPELMKYERSLFVSGKRSEYSHYNKTSVFSSGTTEEELIIKGEINKDAKNKEEDFDNNSFKKLVKNNGGIVIKNIDNISNIGSSQGVNSSIFDFGKETISEIKSKHSFPFRQINGKIGSSLRGSGIKQDLVYNTMSEKNRITNHLKNNIKLKNLGESYKINISMQDNYQFLNVPKVDEPLPDIEELSSGSPIFIGRNSLISE